MERSLIHKSLQSLKLSGKAAGLAALMAVAGGCETQSWLDPSEMGRYNHSPLVVPVLRNLDTGLAEGKEQFTMATDIRQSDLEYNALDYSVGANDLLQVSITDLVGPGIETIKSMRVSESGFVSLPLIGQVKAAGLTEAQLETAISQAYADQNLIRSATVSVVTIEARNRTFSIYGAVAQVGQYAIVDSEFTLRDALVLARDMTSQLGIDYIYVYRKIDQDQVREGAPVPAPRPPANALPGPDVLSPRSQAPVSLEPKMMAQQPTPTQPASGAEGRIIQVGEQQLQIQGGQATVPAVTPVTTATDQPVAPAASGGEFQFNELAMPNNQRVIRIPVKEFQSGDPRYDIVIKPNDFIWVPQPVIGEYYVGGHVLRTGVYSLSARDITLRSAIIAAGGLDQLAMPHRTEIVRKIDRFKKVYVRLDLSKVFNGQEPDILLKPDDEIMVGTNAIAPFLAAFRNAFRITYGMGFLYDRNFADQDDFLGF